MDLATMEPLGDDATSLQEALRALRGWDCEFESLFGLDEDSSSSSSDAGAEPRGKPRQRKKTARKPYMYTAKPPVANPRKAELRELRKQVTELQEIVDIEKFKLPPPAELTGEALVINRAWEHIAAGQQTERFKAESENETLRKVMATQVKSAQKIEALTRRMESMQVALSNDVHASMAHYAGPELSVDEHLQYLESLRLKAAEELSSGEYATNESPTFSDIRMSKYAEGAVVAEFAIQWLLLFPLQAVADAMWARVNRMQRNDRVFDFKDLAVAQDVTVCQFVSKTMPSSAAYVYEDDETERSNHSQIASRRLRAAENGSVLILGNMRNRLHEVCRDDGDPINGTCVAIINGDCWMRVERLPAPAPHDLTRVKWFRRYHARPSEEIAPSAAERACRANYVVNSRMHLSFKRGLEESIQDVENTLLTPSARQLTLPGA